MSDAFDDVIIGSGQAGTPLASALADAGRRVALVERAHVGGTCVNVGCTPTKTMVASARAAHVVRRAGAYGVRVGEPEVDMPAVRRRARDVVEGFRSSNEKGLLENERIELIVGEARFTAPRTLAVRLDGGGERTLAGERVFLNTGARPSVPPLDGLGDVPFLDSSGMLELEEVPEHLVVLGGGYVGVEFGQMFRRFGSRVTLVQRGPHLLPREDEDVSTALEEILRQDGIDLRLGCDATAVSGRAGQLRLELRGPDGEGAVEGTHLLVAVGRTPNTEALELDAGGVAVDRAGHVVVNAKLETGAPGVFAMGDVTGGAAFTHISYDDFRILRGNLLQGADLSTAGRLVPYTVFTDPQLGRVGLTEREASAQHRVYRVARLPMERVARAIETDETRGVLKVLVDEHSGRILGAAMLAVEGGEMAGMLQIAMMGGVPYTALRDAAFAHPTFAESLNNLFSTIA